MTIHPKPAAEELSGIGHLLRAGKPLAKIFYNLELRTAADGYEIEGDLSVSQDTSMRSQVLAVLDSPEILTLVLGDGRKLEVHTTRGDRFEAKFHIVAHNPPGFIAP
ncbi:MAG: hypothetical protein ABI847_07515 [Anaerolineales bacterium]